MKAEALSSPDVGSSRIKTPGSFNRLSPIETRRSSPPERPWASLVWARWVSRSSERRDETMEEMLGFLGVRRVAEKAKVSETVRRGRHASC